MNQLDSGEQVHTVLSPGSEPINEIRRRLGELLQFAEKSTEEFQVVDYKVDIHSPLTSIETQAAQDLVDTEPEIPPYSLRHDMKLTDLQDLAGTSDDAKDASDVERQASLSDALDLLLGNDAEFAKYLASEHGLDLDDFDDPSQVFNPDRQVRPRRRAMNALVSYAGMAAAIKENLQDSSFIEYLGGEYTPSDNLVEDYGYVSQEHTIYKALKITVTERMSNQAFRHFIALQEGADYIDNLASLPLREQGSYLERLHIQWQTEEAEKEKRKQEATDLAKEMLLDPVFHSFIYPEGRPIVYEQIFGNKEPTPELWLDWLKVQLRSENYYLFVESPRAQKLREASEVAAQPHFGQHSKATAPQRAAVTITSHVVSQGIPGSVAGTGFSRPQPVVEPQPGATSGVAESKNTLENSEPEHGKPQLKSTAPAAEQDDTREPIGIPKFETHGDIRDKYAPHAEEFTRLRCLAYLAEYFKAKYRIAPNTPSRKYNEKALRTYIEQDASQYASLLNDPAFTDAMKLYFKPKGRERLKTQLKDYQPLVPWLRSHVASVVYATTHNIGGVAKLPDEWEQEFKDHSLRKN